MPDSQRDKGRVITLPIMIYIKLLGMCSCSPYYYQSKGPEITHVLALSKEGDTLKIPIKDIKPNVVYNVVGYDWYHTPSGYYNRWNNPYYHPHYYNIPKPVYRPNNNINMPNIPSNNGSGPNVSSPAVVTPPPNPAVNNPKKNN